MISAMKRKQHGARASNGEGTLDWMGEGSGSEEVAFSWPSADSEESEPADQEQFPGRDELGEGWEVERGVGVGEEWQVLWPVHTRVFREPAMETGRGLRIPVGCSGGCMDLRVC